MKRYLIAFLLLLTVLLGLFIGLQIFTNRTAVQIVYTETTLSGDVAEAEGIRLALQLHSAQHLFWDVELTTGKEPKTETEFSFVYNVPRTESSPTPRFTLGLGINSFHASSSGDLLENHGTLMGQYDMIKAVADRAPAGETYTENIPLSEYFTYYPLYVDIRLGDLSHDDLREYNYVDQKYGDEIDALFSVLEETFRFPIAEGDMQEITVEKRADGTISGVHSNPAEKIPRLYLESFSVIASDMVYFTATPRRDDGSTVPYEGDYGIFAFPYEIRPYASAYPGMEESYTEVYMDQLALVFPLDTDYQVADMSLSPDETELYLTLLRTTDQGTEISLLILDRATATEKQHIPLYVSEKEGAVTILKQTADYLLYLIDYKTFVAADRYSGSWEEVLTVSDPSIYDFWISERYGRLAYNLVAAYDGERIVVAAYSGQYGINGSETLESSLCTVYMSVYSEKGNLYTGKFTSSLDTGTELRYNYICKPLDGTSPVLTLP